MSGLNFLNTINTPVSVALLVTFFATVKLGKKSFRPGLKIVTRHCPSLYIMPIWVFVVIFTFVAWQTVPDTKYEGLTCDGSIPKIMEKCETARLHKAYAEGLMVMAFAFFIFHIVMTYYRVGKGITIAKWPALIICETAKTVTASFFLVGALSFKDTGETTAGSTFFVSIIIVFSCLLTITLGRLVTLIQVANSPGGLTSTNFNSKYFGTDPKCPFATWACCCEKDAGPEPSISDGMEVVQNSNSNRESVDAI
jgi:hypothetical protein